MRIGIDATAVSDREGTGMQSYVFNLTKNLLALDDGNEYVVYCRQTVPEAFLPFAEKARFRVCALRSRKLCEQLWLSVVSRSDSLDVLHCICSLPLAYPKPAVLTVHGLSWRLTPEVFTSALRWYWILTAERTMKKAQRLLAITQWTKDVIHKRLGISEHRVDVVHHGVDHALFTPSKDEAPVDDVKRRYSLPRRYILHVGSLLPVKNLPTLIRSFRELIRHETFSDLCLVLAGGKGWGADAIKGVVSELQLQGKVIFTGFVPTADLPNIYRAAELFVFPSLYEGFGIPMLESFACGTPVVSSSASCLPEVGGQAALFVDPRDEAQLTSTMARVLSEKELRDRLVDRGLERVKEFTWERTAEQTLRVYEKACCGGR